MVKKLSFILLFLAGVNVCAQEFEVTHFNCKIESSIFSASFFKNDLVVCSNKKDRLFKTVIDKSNEETVDLYLLKSDSLHRFSNEIRTPFNDGPITFNGDFTQCIVSLNNSHQKLTKNKSTLGLFEYRVNKEGEWKLFSEFPFNSENYDVSHPFIKGDTLFFCSNMPNSIGGFDIWYSVLKRNKWQQPINAGGSVNTARNEMFPSFYNNQLFFSSDRIPENGLDIYKSRLNGSCVLLEEPLNSKYDDFGIISNDNFKTGYFTTNRKGKDQIWKLKFLFPEFNDCDSIVKTYFCYNFFDDNGVDFNEVNGLVYQWRINDEVVEGRNIDYCFPKTGDYEVFLDIKDTIVNDTFYDQSYFYIHIDYEVQPYISAPDTVKVNEEFTLSAKESFLPDFESPEFYWFIDDHKIQGDEVTHSYAKKGIYTIKLGALDKNGKKDCVYRTIVCGDFSSPEELVGQMLPGDDVPNDLVEKVKRFYVELKDSNNIVYRLEAYKTKELIDTNSFEYKNLVGDKNFLIKHLEEEDAYVYLIGKFEDVKEAHKQWRYLVNNGMTDLKLRSFEDEGFEFEELIILESLVFDVAKFDLKKQSFEELDKLVKVLKENVSKKLEIAAHTDNQGSDKYNFELSQDRAKSVRDYIVDKGINPSRIKCFGRGEEFPIATNNSEEGRQKNRRVEFKITN